MKKIGVGLLAVLAVNSAVGANWLSLGQSPDKEQSAYIDSNSVYKINVHSNAKIITYFSKLELKHSQKTIEGKTYNYYITQNKNDCQNNRFSITGIVYYSQDGTQVGYGFRGYDEWVSVFPDTLGEMQLNTACQIAGYR